MKITAAIILFVLVSYLSWWWLASLREQLLAREIVDQPNERTVHQGEVPRGGGIVIVAFLLASLLVMALWSNRPQTFFAFAALSGAWALLSWYDDRHSLSPRFRFASQIVLSVLTLALFGYVAELRLNAELVLNLGWLGALCSFVGLLWFSNLYNFMDGMDGLAASQTIIGAMTLGVWLLVLGDWWLALCCLVLSASSYGFLLRNWHPASLFMGDVGSITIGAFFATMMIYLNTFHGIPVLCLVLLFGVFVLDATVTILRRLCNGEKIWLPHRSHYYQRLATLGLHHAHIVLAYIALMISCSIMASLALADHARISQMCALAVGMLLAAMLLVRRMEARRA